MQSKEKKAEWKTKKKNDSSILHLPVFNLEPCTLNPKPGVKQKHPCPDCRFCQGCSQDRCRLCRSPKKTTHKKLSMAEQIAWYERINTKKTKRKK